MPGRNDIFDVDCPRTPDGDDKQKRPNGNKKGASPTKASKYKSYTNNNGVPRSSGGRPPVRSPPSPRGRSADATKRELLSNTAITSSAGRNNIRSHSRHRYDPRTSGTGLDPEERVTPIRAGAPRSGPGALAYHARSSSSSKSNTHNPNNPFGRSIQEFSAESNNRQRSASDSWWKEEIVDETLDKTNSMESYYGLTKSEKTDLYGKSKNPFEQENGQEEDEIISARKRAGYTHLPMVGFGEPIRRNEAGVAIGIGYNSDGSVETGLLDFEQEAKDPESQHQHHQNQHHRQQQVPPPPSQGNTEKYSFYEQASQIRNSGHYQEEGVVDDYSFSVVDLPKATDIMGPAAKKARGGSKDSFLQMPKWFAGFAPGAGNSSSNISSGSKHSLPNNITSETNIAPRPRGNSQEWWANSPKVTFDTEYGRKKSRWSNMSPHQKIGAGVIWVALLCALMSVTVSQLRKSANVNMDPGQSSGAMGYLPVASVQTDSPTLFPSSSPSNNPTPNPTPLPTNRPTLPPITKPPTNGYASIHGKDYDGTEHPTRSPTTSRPTSPPTSELTPLPSSAPTVSQKVQAAPEINYCTDDHGYYLNHLENPKDCVWLYNDNEGESDRKNKNCGNHEFHMTALGAHCQATCAKYNGCTPKPSSSSSSMTTMTSNTVTKTDYVTPTAVTICADRNGMYKNHLDNEKDCYWLHNDKPGQTERKDKNCGYGAYPITEVGKNCPATCIWYNKSGCSTIEVKPESLSTNNLRTSSSVSSSSSTSCVNGSGEYLDHTQTRKKCQWLHGENPSNANTRQQKNCGTEKYPLTELGRECPWSCQDFNGCSEK